MQVSSRFASKLLVSSAVSEYFEDKKIEAFAGIEEEYEDAMYDMMEDDGYDPRDYDDVYYGQDDDYDDYDPYDYYDARDDYYFMDDYYLAAADPIERKPLLDVPDFLQTGETLGAILSRALANA